MPSQRTAAGQPRGPGSTTGRFAAASSTGCALARSERRERAGRPSTQSLAVFRGARSGKTAAWFSRLRSSGFCGRPQGSNPAS